MPKPLLRIVAVLLVPCLAFGQLRTQSAGFRNISEFCTLSSEPVVFTSQALALPADIEEQTAGNRVASRLAEQGARQARHESSAGPASALEGWGARYKGLLQEHGFLENGVYADLLSEMERDVMAEEGHKDNTVGLASMMESARQEHNGYGLNENVLPVTPRTILSGMALYVIHRSLAHGFIESDLTDLQDCVDAYNGISGIPYLLDLPSLFVISLTPFFPDAALFGRMYPQLAQLPGEEGDVAVALALFFAGIHRDATSADEPDDYRSYQALLDRALRTLRRTDVSPAVRVATVLGVTRFVSFMAPFLTVPVPRTIVRRKSDRSDHDRERTRQEMSQILREIELLIAHYDADIRAGIEEVDRKIGHDWTNASPENAIRMADPFLLGLRVSFFSHLERLLEAGLKGTITDAFLSILDTVSGLQLARIISALQNSLENENAAYLSGAEPIRSAFIKMMKALDGIKQRNLTPHLLVDSPAGPDVLQHKESSSQMRVRRSNALTHSGLLYEDVAERETIISLMDDVLRWRFGTTERAKLREFGFSVILTSDERGDINAFKELANKLGFSLEMSLLPSKIDKGQIIDGSEAIRNIAFEMHLNREHAKAAVLVIARPVEIDSNRMIEILALDRGAGFSRDIVWSAGLGHSTKLNPDGYGLTTIRRTATLGNRGICIIESGGRSVIFGEKGIISRTSSDITKGSLITVRRLIPSAPAAIEAKEVPGTAQDPPAAPAPPTLESSVRIESARMQDATASSTERYEAGEITEPEWLLALPLENGLAKIGVDTSVAAIIRTFFDERSLNIVDIGAGTSNFLSQLSMGLSQVVQIGKRLSIDTKTEPPEGLKMSGADATALHPHFFDVATSNAPGEHLPEILDAMIGLIHEKGIMFLHISVQTIRYLNQKQYNFLAVLKAAGFDVNFYEQSLPDYPDTPRTTGAPLYVATRAA